MASSLRISSPRLSGFCPAGSPLYNCVSSYIFRVPQSRKLSDCLTIISPIFFLHASGPPLNNTHSESRYQGPHYLLLTRNKPGRSFSFPRLPLSHCPAQRARCSVTDFSGMSAEFLFVPTLSAGSTGKARLLQQADAKRHAAIVAHRRKVRLQSKSQAISPQPYDLSNSTTPVAPAQPHVTPDINPTANKSLVPGLSGSQQNGGFPLISKSNFELSSLLPSRDVNPDAAEDGDSETCANLQPSRLVVSDHLDYEANTESIAARTVNGGIREHQDLSVVIRSTATSKPTYPLSHGYSDSFCRAIEYCTSILPLNQKMRKMFG